LGICLGPFSSARCVIYRLSAPLRQLLQGKEESDWSQGWEARLASILN
jgi:hypothetical protein